MSATVFIDGEHGTTGLQIRTRLEGRTDVELLSLAVDDRRNIDMRRQMLNEADLVILCLPDDAARESVSMIQNPNVKVVDASTAHRVADDWVYGMPEYDAEQRERIAQANRVSNPGCYAIASIALLHPLDGFWASAPRFSRHDKCNFGIFRGREIDDCRIRRPE